MSNSKTGLWSAIGALLGGVAGAAAGHYAAEARPRRSHRYTYQPSGSEVEDAMVVGAGTGAIVGAFVAGTLAGEPEPTQATPPPQFPR